MGNDEVLHTPQISTTGALPSDVILCYTEDIPLADGDLTLLQGMQ